MSLVGWRWVTLALEHVSQVSSTVCAHYLRPLHSKRSICVSRYSTWNCIEESWPSASRLELLIGAIQGCVTCSAAVSTFGGIVLVVFAGEGRFCALLSDYSELVFLRVSSLIEI